MGVDKTGITRDYRPLGSDAAHSWTLPGYIYSDPQVFEAEKERIFYRHWQVVAHETEMPEPGDYVCAEIADEKVFVIRGADGALRGFYNVCQHRAHRLLEGRGNAGRLIVCPYHAWSYSTDGALQAARHTDAMPDFDKGCLGLTPVRVESQLGFVFVNLDPDAVPLGELAADMFDDIREKVPFWDELVVQPPSGDGAAMPDLKANWKVLGENCRECYHCAVAHPAFVDLIDMPNYKRGYGAAWMRNLGPVRSARNRAYDIAEDEPCQAAIYWHLWPNCEIGVVPGEASMNAFRYYPAGPEATRMQTIVLTRPGETIRPERLDYHWNILWNEDEGICESVHGGLKSRGYKQGRFVVDPARDDASEEPVFAFQKRYAEVMGL